MDRLGVQQPVGGTFLVQAKARNSDQTGKATLLGVAGTYFAIGGVITIQSGGTFSASGPLSPGRAQEGMATYKCDSAGVALYGVSVIALSMVEGQEVGTQLEVKVDREVECVVREATPTLTPAPESTEEPGGIMPSEPAMSLGCDHRIPGVESDVLVQIEFLMPGQTVTGWVTGPGVIGDGLFSAPADESGVADAAVPINDYGFYEAFAEGDGFSVGYASIEVTSACEDFP